MSLDNNDVASLFDPNFDDAPPAHINPGALPPSWLARIGERSAAVQALAPDHPVADRGFVVDRDDAADVEVDENSAARGGSAFDAAVKKAERDGARARRAVRLPLLGVEGAITRTNTTRTVWFVQEPGPWNMRPAARQRQYIRQEALVMANLAEQGVTSLHRRVLRTPWPVRQWAHAHDDWAEPPRDVPGALSWADYLRGQQHALLWDSPTQKGRYWGVDLPPRSTSSSVLAWLATATHGGRNWWLVGRLVRSIEKWERGTAARETTALGDHLAAVERIMSGAGVRASLASPARMDYLLRRSASLGLPLDVDGVLAGGGGWEESDIPALEDLVQIALTPGDGYTAVTGQVDGRDYTGYAIVLTVGRMAPLPIPERMLPWQVIGDQSGEPIEWSERIRLRSKAETLRAMRRQTSKIENQYDMYTVEHDQSPPQELGEQHKRAQDIISDIEEDHSGLSVRTEGWYRMLVVGQSPDQVKKKVSELQELYQPHISLEHEHGQYQLLREFIPGSKLANTAHRRRMSVEALAAGKAGVSDRIGDRRGVVLGQTCSISPRPVAWDIYHAHLMKNKSGLTPLVGVPGAGKTFLAGMIVYQAVRAGVYSIVLDPSGPLKRLAQLPEFRGVAQTIELTGRRSRPGTLNPYRVVVDPRPDDPDYDPANPDYRDDPNPAAAARAQFDADVRAAGAERISVAVSVLKMMLTPARLAQEWTETVLQTAANRVGGERHHNLREVLAAVAVLAADDDNVDLRTCARSVLQDLEMMADLVEARVLFPATDTDGDAVADIESQVDQTMLLTVLTMPGLQLPQEGSDPSQWTPQQRMAAPLNHLAAWLANRLVYEMPRSTRKLLFLDENKYLEQTGAGRTLNHRISRDSRKWLVRAIVSSQLPDDFLGVDGGDDRSALAYEVIIGDLGGNKHAIEGALKLLNLPLGQGYEELLSDLGSGGEDTFDEDTDTRYIDEARRFVVKMADDIEMIRSEWTNFAHLAHVTAALDSRARTATFTAPGVTP